MRGFHPSTRITARHVRPVVVYAISHSLPPDSSTRSASHPAGRLDFIPIRVRSTTGPRPTASDRDAILRSDGGPVHHGAIREQVRYPVRLHNRTDRNRGYLVYRGARAWSGRWTMRVCGAPYNDGLSVQELSGTYRTVSRIRPPRVAVCGQVPPHADDIERHAARRACA